MGGLGDGSFVWDHDIEWLGGDGISVIFAAGTTNTDAVYLPVRTFVELEIDELVDLAGRDVGFNAALNGGKEASVGGERSDFGEFVDDADEDFLLVLDAVKVTV